MSKQLLDRLTVRSQGPDAPSRRAMIKEFCRLTHWVDPKGRPCLSSANVAIGRLEKTGHVVLPPATHLKPRSGPRKLRDDGLALPSLPELPCRVDQISDLRLYLITGGLDPQHLLWNRLICREHPLGSAPLVGAQLRYLILAGTEAIGAFGFGPASFHLCARDSWIGWDSQARAQNRSKVLGLSRFLLRPGLKCQNLASRCYGMVLKRVRADWEQRYGIVPLLVETFVDRSTHTGRSLLAANWRRLGTTQGRGRSSPRRHIKPKSSKDLWVWQWDEQARARLQSRVLPQVVPRSVFQSSPQLSDSWVVQELDGLELGHIKLEQRFASMLQSRWQHPSWSFYTSFGARRDGVAAYKFVQNPRADLTFEALLQPHQSNTRRRMAAEKVVVLAQDTTTLSYNTLHATEGLGPIGNTEHSGRGLLLHSLQAFRLDGIPLGCAWAEVWAREAKSDTAQRNVQSIDQKESGRWLDAYQAACAAAAQMPQTRIVVCGDRESDIVDLYDRATVAPENVRFLIRSQHDRILNSGKKLSEHLSAQPVGGILEVKVPRRQNTPARTARLELRWAEVQVVPPRTGCKNSWGALTLFVLEAKEIQPPPGVEPIHWVLLTDWKINDFKTACRLVRWYGLRWGIECWHQVLKDGCGVETRQMKSAQALARSLALDIMVAWRILLLCRLGKSHPNLPASVLYSPEELAILVIYKNKTLPKGFSPHHCSASVTEPPDDPAELSSLRPPDNLNSARPAVSDETPMTLFQANLLVAMLGGFWGRKSDGAPGPDLLGRGLIELATLVWWERLQSKRPSTSCAGKDPPLDPGFDPPNTEPSN